MDDRANADLVAQNRSTTRPKVPGLFVFLLEKYRVHAESIFLIPCACRRNFFYLCRVLSWPHFNNHGVKQMKLAERPAKIDPGQRYNIGEACCALGVGRNLLYRKINAGELRVIREGSRTLVPGSEIIRLSSVPSA